MRNGHNGAPVRGLKLKLLVLLVLCALPMGGSVSVLLTGGSPLPLLAYAVASLLAFGLYRYDKQQAAAGQWRTPEKVCTGLSCWAVGQGHWWRNKCFATKPANCLISCCSG